MKKIILNYDPNTTNVYDLNGVFIGSVPNLSYEDCESTVDITDKLIKLKNAGFEPKDIMEMSKAGLL